MRPWCSRSPLWALVKLRGEAAAPFIELVHQAVDGPTVLDFHLPANRLAVRVVDAVTGEGIPRARVHFAEKDPAGEATSSQRTTSVLDANAVGEVDLPPIRLGRVRVSASAEGYERAEALDLEVDEGTRERRVIVPLRPEVGVRPASAGAAHWRAGQRGRGGCGGRAGARRLASLVGDRRWRRKGPGTRGRRPASPPGEARGGGRPREVVAGSRERRFGTLGPPGSGTRPPAAGAPGPGAIRPPGPESP